MSRLGICEKCKGKGKLFNHFCYVDGKPCTEGVPQTITRDGKTYRLTAATRQGVPTGDAEHNVDYLKGLGYTQVFIIHKNGYFYNYARKEG